MPYTSPPNNQRIMENFLKVVSSELESFEQPLTGEPSQDAKRLQAEKQRLQQQVGELQQSYQQLQQQTDSITSQQQEQLSLLEELSQTIVSQLDELSMED